MSARDVPKFEVEKSEEYREIHLDGVFGGITPNGAKMVIYTEEHEPQIKPGGKPGDMELGKITREVQAELHLSPVQFKSLFKWMKKHLENYEDRFGEIEIQVEKEKRPDKMFG